VLDELAQDPAVVVRGCTAHTIAAAMRHARPEAVAAFWPLIDTDDVMLTADAVHRLMTFIGNEDPDAVMPVVERMLASAEPDVRQAGGQLACFAALEWGTEQLMQSVLNSDDVEARKGVAGVSAHRLPHTSNAALAGSTLETLFEDQDATVREAAAELSSVLRGKPLRPFAADACRQVTGSSRRVPLKRSTQEPQLNPGVGSEHPGGQSSTFQSSRLSQSGQKSGRPLLPINHVAWCDV
jgi:hypothetical protein